MKFTPHARIGGISITQGLKVPCKLYPIGKCRFLSVFAVCWLLGCVAPVRAQQPPITAGRQTGAGAVALPAPRLKENLNRILSGQEYQPETNNDKNQIAAFISEVRQLWKRLVRWWNRLFKTSGIRAGSSLFIYVLLTFILSGLLWIVYRLFRGWSPRENSLERSPISAQEEEALAEIERDPAVWLTQAEEWAAKSDYRRAFRAMFLALLLELDRANLLVYDRARTNGEYLRHLQATHNQPVYHRLVPLAEAFETHWYGDTPATLRDYQAIRQAHDALPKLIAAASSIVSGALSAPTALPANPNGKASIQ